MIYNYFNIAFRKLTRQKGFAALNILGLAIGIAAVLLIFRMIAYELSFNKNFAHYNRIVRIVMHEKGLDGQESHTRGMPLPAMEVAEHTVPQFIATTRTKEAWPTVIVPNPSGGPALQKFSFQEGEIAFFGQPDFFKIFDFPWLSGDPSKALQAPNTVVLTRKTAERCFGAWQNALGKTVLIDNDPMMVEGVVADAPQHCDMPILMVISYQTLLSNKAKFDYNEDWGSTSSNDQMFALLGDAAQFEAAQQLVTQIGQKEYNQNASGQSETKGHRLQRFSDMHYDERYGTSATHVMPKERLIVLGSIGFLVLLMACFNFINLSTAQALRRSQEVGVRKTLGSSRGNLFAQFMSETALITIFSSLLGVVMATLASPLLKHISEVPAELPFLSQGLLWLFLGALTLAVTLLSGFYPALVLAGFNPVQALKNDVSKRAVGGATVRKGLVVFQFAIAQALIVGTIITLSQLDYIRNMDLGFDQELVYTFDISGDSLSQSKMAGFKQRLLQLPGVESVAFGSDQPSSGSTWMTNFSFGRGMPDQKFNTNIKFCDGDYQKTYGIRLAAGRWLEQSDTTKEYLINETLMRKVGISKAEEVIGKEVRLGGGRYRPVVGVIKDFHAHSAHQEIAPMVIGTRLERMYGAGVKINPKNMAAATAAIQREFDATYPEQVFDANWFDESLAQFYMDENRFAATCKGFGGLAIFISCLGLLGLAAHAAQRRTKEVGVRKVLGASVPSIIALLSKEFLALVLIAVVIASPLAWFFMQKWLSDFVYHIDIQWWMFVVAGMAAIGIAFLTVSYQSIKAALANPVKSLRSE